MLQCIWNLTDEWTNSLLVYETDLYLSPYETLLSRKNIIIINIYIYIFFFFQAFE